MPLILNFFGIVIIQLLAGTTLSPGIEIERTLIFIMIVKPPRMYPIIIGSDLVWIANIWVLIVTEINDHLRCQGRPLNWELARQLKLFTTSRCKMNESEKRFCFARLKSTNLERSMMNLGGYIYVVTNFDSKPWRGGNGIPAKFCQQQHSPLTALTVNY